MASNEVLAKLLRGDILSETSKYDPNYIYGNILPFKVNKQTHEKSLAAPGIIKNLAQALTAPKRAYQGDFDGFSPQASQEALNIAGLLMEGGIGYSSFDPPPEGTLSMNASHGERFNFNKLPADEARTIIRSKADELAGVLNKEGFQATVEHTGSRAGPSSYVSIFDPTTMRYIKDPARFSNHSKGAFNSQFVHEMLSQDDVNKFIELARSLRVKK